MDVSKAFSERLRELREERGLNQEQLGEAIGGVSRGSISYYEKGERVPTIEVLGVISELFNVSADYLIGRTDVRRNDVEEQAISRRLALSSEAVEMLSDYSQYKGGGNCPEIDTIHLLLDNLRGTEGGRLLRALAAFFSYGGTEERELDEELLMLKVTKELYAFKSSIVSKSK